MTDTIKASLSRNYVIDALRLLFAFFVVCLHVPLSGANILMPLLRCAVPFFYIVSGYYVMASSVERDLVRNAKRWALLWLKYFVIIGIISIILHAVSHEPIQFSKGNILEIFVFYGKTTAMDHIVINGVSTGLYTIWFLLGGSYAFLFFYMLRNVKGIFVFGLVACMFFLGIALCMKSYNIPRWFYLSIPYIFLGMLLRKTRDNWDMIKNSFLMFMGVISFIGMSIEWMIFNQKGIAMETSMFTPLFMYFCMLLTFRVRLKSKFVIKMGILGRATTLPIYIYHRAVYALLLAVTPPLYKGFLYDYGALIVFFMTGCTVIIIMQFGGWIKMRISRKPVEN